MGPPVQSPDEEQQVAVDGPGFTSLSCLMSSSGHNRRSTDDLVGLPDLDAFDQYVTQADVDRDPFAIALFEVKPIDLGHPKLLRRLGQTLLQFASPNTQVAYIGRNRLALISLTDDTTHRWVAPVTTALRSTLDVWWAEESSYAVAAADPDAEKGTIDIDHGKELQDDLGAAMDVSDLTDRPTLVTGVARGLSYDVWVNAEQALAKAYKQQIPVAEFQLSDRVRRETFPIDHHNDDSRRNRSEEPTTKSTNQSTSTVSSDAMAGDDRLVVLSRRIEPVNRPEPIWHWLRLIPGLRTDSERQPSTIELNKLAIRDQALIEAWLANQVAELFAAASSQLRLSIPLSAEACRSRSFAQRIFPLLERYKVPPSRLVVEIDMSVISRADSLLGDNPLPPTAPSVQRFIRDAAAVNVGVAVTGFNGGWNAWYNLRDLPIDYLIPSPEMIYQAGRGDHGPIRALVMLASEADKRGIELIAPETKSDLSEHALTQLGFTYGEGPIDSAADALPAREHYVPSTVHR